MEHYDLIIIGAGPSGIACAIEAEKEKLNYIVVEKGFLVNSIYNFPTNMSFFSSSERLEIGDIPFISHSDKPTRKEALEYYRRLAFSYSLNIKYRTPINKVKREDGRFVLNSPDMDGISSDFLIAATGYYDKPRMLNVEGEDLPKVKHYYDDAHPYIGMNVLVIGAANSACDVALETWQKGANVTMAVRSATLYQKVKYWILPNIENRIKEGSIQAFINTTVNQINEDSVVLNTPDGQKIIPNDYVLAMTGYQPDFDFLESMGIRFEDTPEKHAIVNEDTLESSVDKLYLAGVIISGLSTSKLFIENTRHHGSAIINDIKYRKALGR